MAITNIYKGTVELTNVLKIYKGSDLVYSSGPPPYQMLDSLATAKSRLAGAGANGYVVFAGGGDGSSDNAQVEAYNMNSSGTKTSLSDLAPASEYFIERMGTAGAGANGYAVFAGGSGYSNRVEAYNMNSSGTKTSLSTLTYARIDLAGAGANGYAVFAGGESASYYNRVEAYNMNSSGTKTSLSNLATAKSSLAGAGANNYVVFAGGYYYASVGRRSAQVEAYNMNSSGTKTSLSDLATAKNSLAGAGANGYAVFAGGYYSNYGNKYNRQVESYDMNSSGTKTSLSNLAIIKYNLAGAGANGYAVFAGGNGSSYNAQVEAYYLGS